MLGDDEVRAAPTLLTPPIDSTHSHSDAAPVIQLAFASDPAIS